MSEYTFNDFFSKSTAEDGKKLYLKLPNGAVTSEWLLLFGRDSEPYAEAYSTYRMASIELAAKGTPRAADRAENLAKFIGKLVKAWSFPMELTSAKLAELFTQAPHILEDADNFVHDRERFFA